MQLTVPAACVCVCVCVYSNTIAAIAAQFKQVATPAFAQYAKQVQLNARALGRALVSRGYKLATDGTDNHLLLWDLRPLSLTGSKMEALCDLVHITLNKNAVHGDVSALVPGGVRLGTPALTSRGFVEQDFEVVAGFLHEAVQLAVRIAKSSGKELAAFKLAIEKDEAVRDLADRIKHFSAQFFMPGCDVIAVKN